MKARDALSLVMALWLLSACTLSQRLPAGDAPRPAPAAALGVASRDSVVATSPIEGRVSFGDRAAQALGTDVTAGAAITLIDSNGNTAATTTSDPVTGAFTVNAPGSLQTMGATYVLEAVKGLNKQQVGKVAARLRTIIQWNGSAWLSITANANPPIQITALTTAVALTSALESAGLPAANTINMVTYSTAPASLDASKMVPAHPKAELDALATALTNYITFDMDPVASMPAIKPTISSVSPGSAAAGQVIQILGTGFNPVSDTVSIGGVNATPLLATTTHLILIVPNGVAVGTALVSVNNGRWDSTNAWPLTIAQVGQASTPVITGVSDGTLTAGSQITLLGQNFQNGTTTVNFAGYSAGSTVPATTMTVQANSIIATIPTGAAPGLMSVNTSGSGGGTSNSYFLAIKPIVTSLKDAGNASVVTGGPTGTIVTVNGAGFGNSTTISQLAASLGSGAVTITPAGYPSPSNTTFTIQIPATALSGNLIVTTPFGGTTGTPFTVTPNISSISPTSGGTGTTVTINGTAFGPSAPTNGGVKFGTIAAGITSWSNTRIVATAPNGISGTLNVQVTADSGQSNTASFAVTTTWLPNHSHYVWDSSNRMYVTGSHCCSTTVFRESGAAVFTPFATVPVSAGRIAVDTQNRVWNATVAERGTNVSSIIRINPDGTWVPAPIAKAAGGGVFGLALDSAGNAYYGTWSDKFIRKIDVNLQGVSNLTASGDFVSAVAVDVAGNVYWCEGRNGTIKKWVAATPSEAAVTLAVAGSGGPYGSGNPSPAGDFPIGIAFGPDGYLYTAGKTGIIRKIDPSNGAGASSTWVNLTGAEGCADPHLNSISVQDNGDVYVGGYTCSGSATGRFFKITKTQSVSLYYGSGNPSNSIF